MKHKTIKLISNSSTAYLVHVPALIDSDSLDSASYSSTPEPWSRWCYSFSDNDISSSSLCNLSMSFLCDSFNFLSSCFFRSSAATLFIASANFCFLWSLSFFCSSRCYLYLVYAGLAEFNNFSVVSSSTTSMRSNGIFHKTDSTYSKFFITNNLLTAS